MKKWLIAAVLWLLPSLALADSSPGFYYGFVPTAGQWNSYFSGKLDNLNGPAGSAPYYDGTGQSKVGTVQGDCSMLAWKLTCTTLNTVAPGNIFPLNAGAGLSISGGNLTAPTMTATAGGLVPTPPNSATQFLNGTGAFSIPSGTTGANPSATAGPSAVNGSATTFMRSDAAPAVQKGSASQFGIVECDGVTTSCSNGVVAELRPGGRLTLQSGHPVASSDEAGVSTIYYDTYITSVVPVNGVALSISSNEVSMGLSSVNVTSGNLYDAFAVNNSGSLAICAGPAWTNSTTRSVGIALSNGVWTNSSQLTHCYGGSSGTTDYGAVSANAATYLGTFDATANGQTTLQLKPAAGSGGSNTVVGLWNAYNRVPITSRSQDSTTTWSYATTTWRAADGSNLNRITFVDGLQQSNLSASYAVNVGLNASSLAYGGVDLDSTSATPTGIWGTSQTTSAVGENLAFVRGEDNFSPQLGLHYVQAMEYGSGTDTWSGSTLMLLTLRMDE